jgi:Zn-dependent metalloprotease
MTTTHNPIHCIVPPIILEEIARNGSEQQRQRVLSTLARDHSLRMVRQANASRPRRVDPLAAVQAGLPRRTIRDAQNTENLSAPIVRNEGDGPTGDAAVDEAYDGLGGTYQLFWDIYDRDSIDDEGLPLDGVVHYGVDYDNAFWDGQRMVFGDGDGELFNRFTIAIDVIGHELTHGVTEDEAGLVYLGQPGALNESISDVFGSLVKQHGLQQKADDADWLIGAGLLGPDVQGVALRSMKAPGTAYDDDVLGKDPQPAHMDNYVTTTADNGGVHINSGIPNHAFYTAATALGDYAWERAGRIWYETLRDPRLRPTARFRTFARTTMRTARRLYGDTSEEVRAVKAGWDKVGISV